MAPLYQFRPISVADLPMIRRWLETPHVAQWWHDPDEQFALVSEDLDHPAMDQFVVTAHDRPFAYLQCYDPNAWPEGGLGIRPDGTRGIDQFIGEPDMVDCGHGSALIRSFVSLAALASLERLVAKLEEGAAVVLADAVVDLAEVQRGSRRAWVEFAPPLCPSTCRRRSSRA